MLILPMLLAFAPSPGITDTIDKHIVADWQARSVTPAAEVDDAGFLRRVSLDVLGRSPKVSEARAFLADADPRKREKVVEKLLSMAGHAQHFANTTRMEWMPQTGIDPGNFFAGQTVERWLQERFKLNTPADEVVRRLLTAPVELRLGSRSASIPNNADSAALVGFYDANDVKPELLGSVASRLFLGVKLECAQCHDHPFAPIRRPQFWQFAAFFGEFAALPPVPPSFVGPLTPQYDRNRITIPGTETTVAATYFDGSEPEWTHLRSPRQELARWLTDGANPYFARNAVNRMWARFFGLGLVDPIDEPGDANPPSHPELLDELAKLFVQSGYDNRALIRGIVASKAYQRSSKLSHPTQGDARRFARMLPRSLSGLQIYNSFRIATGEEDIRPDSYQVNPGGLRGQFVQQFPTANRPTESQTSILQALLLMNGTAMANATSVKNSWTLAAVIDAPFMDTNQKVDALFLAALARMPTDEEREKHASYIDRGGPSGDKPKALADVFWVLLNSTGFLLNH